MQNCGSDFICVQELQLEREVEQEEEEGGGKHKQKNDDRDDDDVPITSVGNGRRSRKEEECESSNDKDGVVPTTTTTPSSSLPFVLPEWITPLIQNCSTSSNNGNTTTTILPYSIILPPQKELGKIAERNRRVLLADAAITNAIFYRSDKWNPIIRNDDTSEEGGKDGSSSMRSTTSCVTQAFLPVDNGDQMQRKNDNGIDYTTEPIVITSIHLDAQSEEKRVQQLQRCLEQSISLSSTPYIPPCFIAGDYNCELFDGSCVNAFLSKKECELDATTLQSSTPQSLAAAIEEGNAYKENREKECASALRLSSDVSPSKEQLESWDELHASVRKFTRDNFLTVKRVDTGCTRVAYDHDEEDTTSSAMPDETERTMGMWHLDHILYTPSTLVPLAKWSSLEEDPHSRKVGLPNDRIPTDHLPIAASFERHPHPRLSPDAERMVTESLNAIDSSQREELNTHTFEAGQTQAELEQQHRRKNNIITDESTTEAESLQPVKKSKKKKKSPPPPEVIQHIRNSRAALKVLKAEHCTQRENFIEERTVLERMVLQRGLGGSVTCAQWVESGSEVDK